MAELLSVEEALQAVLARVEPLETERVRLADASGRVLAEAARAAVDLPPFPSSAMDGFALRSADTPGRLPVVDRVAAGRPASRPLAAGEAMGIATGGVVPDGADAVVPIERVEAIEDSVEVSEHVPEGANVRPRGGDVESGSLVVEAGTRIGPAQIGALAAAGVGAVECPRRPRVAVLTTGTELRQPGEQLGAGEIYESNGAMLRALLGEAGAEVELLDPVEDTEEAHRSSIERGLGHDVLVTSGGVSVGPHDLVRRIEGELGVEEVFWGVSVRPGKPLAFGVSGRTLVFGLPGNPVSSLVSSVLFVLPALRALQGEHDPEPRYRRAALAAPVTPDSRRDELVRARLTAEGELEPLSGQESHMIASAAAANALVYVPTGPEQLPRGSTVRYLAI
ncbi:MAG TPA: gephyrin-like molybdotransferase Glp [Gaiellaceae bacterium]|jgi:molybdopterin molybdotransferase|nr:gephyrin-like molybdotransferase Glp [Gaiellaceae bacterium]